MKSTQTTTSNVLARSTRFGRILLASAAAMTFGLTASAQVSGSLGLSGNTHFISYGADVWGAGTDLGDILFNPSVELTTEVADGVTGIFGLWFDINDNAESNIGDDIVQEMDVWLGAGFAVGDVDVTVLYQEWMYANQSERIVDLILGLPGELSPSVTIHGRVDGQDLESGVVVVAGIEPSFDVSDSVSIPLAVSVAGNTDEFHGGDAGFTFVSVGSSQSIPLSDITSLDLGLTYYYTNSDTLPNNEDESFLTASAGISVSW